MGVEFTQMDEAAKKRIASLCEPAQGHAPTRR
jgi:hypothetical protein